METLDFIKINFSEWIPCKQVGVLELSRKLVKFFTEYEFRIEAELSDLNNNIEIFKLYKISSDEVLDGLRVGVENGLIYAISCSIFVMYKGINLIGASADFLPMIFEGFTYSTERFELIDAWKTVYDFDELGLMLWVDNGIVESADCLSCDDD